MAAEIYSELQGVASGLLAEFSQGSITYIAPGERSGAADEPTIAPPVSYPFDGVMRGVKQKYIDGSNIIASDLQVTMPGNLVEADVKGFVEAAGTRYKIVHIDRKPALGPAAVFVLIIRK